MNQNLLLNAEGFSPLSSVDMAQYANPSLAQVAFANQEPATLGLVEFPRQHSLAQFLQRFPTGEIPAVGLTLLSILLHQYTHQEQFKLATYQIREKQIYQLNLACNLTEQSCWNHLLESAHQLPSQNLSVPAHNLEPKTNATYSLACFIDGMKDEYLNCLTQNYLAQNEICLLINSNTQAYLAYNKSLFNHNFITNFIRHFDVLLQNLQRNHNSRLQEISLTSKEDIALQIDSWQSPKSDYGDLPIYRQIEQSAQQFPQSVAITFGTQQLTYQQLNTKANQLAHYLISQNVQPQDCVAVFVSPGLEIMIAILAIHKINGVYVPIDTEYPLGRIKNIVSQVSASSIICASERFEEIENSQLNLNLINLPSLNLAQEAAKNPNYPCSPESISHIFFTSGTTGTPKGVVSSHKNLIHYIFTAQEKYRFTALDSFLAATRYTFSISLFTLLLPLVCGGQVNLITLEQLLEPKLLAAAIEKSSFFHLSPSIVKMLLDFLEAEHQSADRFDHVKHASTGGDMIPAEILNRLNHLFTKAEVYAIYGSSEISCMGCTYFVTKDLELKQTLVGKPFNNVQLRVLDRQQTVVPLGVTGEIYFSGEGITQGYLNLPHLTQAKYILLDGERFYRTGDLGRLTLEGNLQMLGRNDHQIQLRGMRIELGEIESNLELHPAISSCVVVAKEDQLGEKQLLAYLTHQNSAPTSKELRSFLQLTLPQYMIPSHFVLVEQFPLTPNGKVDRRALSALELKAKSTESLIAPRTATEEQLANIWREVLQLEQIGINDNFFELGGHSLLATQVISRSRETLGVEISFSSLFASPTIAELASQIETNQTHTSIEPILPQKRNGQAPLSLAQQRLWFLAQMDGQSSAYNIPLALQLTGVVNLTALEQAIAQIVSRHEALRTNFELVEDTAVQIIHRVRHIPLPVIDLQSISEPERLIEYQRIATEEVDRCFDLSQDPLIRTTVVKLAPQSHVLLVTMHHIISDGWSLEIFTQELSTLYTALVKGQPSPLAELSIQYADFAAWQQQWLQTEAFSQQLEYWQQQLAALPALLELPTDRPRPAVQTFQGGVERFTLSAELTRQLQHLTQQAGATLFMTLVAGLSVLMSRYSNTKDLAIGSPIANRNRSQIEPLIGFFVNTLVLRTDLEGDPSFSELLQRVKQMTLDAYAHQDLQFDKLVEILQPERSLSHNPLFQVMFVLQNATSPTQQMPHLTLSTLPVDQLTAQFDLTLSMEETAEGLTGFWQYNRDLFDPETIRRMSGHLKLLLEGIVTHPQKSVTALPLLPEAELRQLLVEWNDTQQDYSSGHCIHQLIEAQAALTPDAVAVVFEDQQLTYRQLNQQANQLARYLTELGVKSEVLVGIGVERSPEMVIALLAILKAGGAYVPIDPKYPLERIEYILEDSQISVLLTRSGVIDSKLTGCQVVDLDSQQQAIAQYSTSNLDLAYSLDTLAYVIYTSGSTGKPKGVLVTHRGISNLAYAQSKTFGIKADSCVLQFASFSFDASISEIVMTFVAGAKLCLATSESLLPGSDLLKLLRQQQVTHVTLPPSALAVLPHEPLPKLEAIVVAGESCPPELAAKWSQGRNFFNAYGPTETTVCATIWQYNHEESFPIGRPIANTQIYILDELLQPVPTGVVGEIYIGSIGIARGYLNRPELTEQRFIVNPFNNSEKIYKTGDLGRYLADGNIEYLGRIDHQVKIRGFRIELGEIEHILNTHVDVAQGTVIAREDQPGNKRIVAYVVPKDNSQLEVTELRQFLQDKLPKYMIPSAFVLLESLPVTSNGKIDRRALPIPRVENNSNSISPRTNTEKNIAQIWQEVLGVQSISVEDNFFHLGGHSLLAVKLSSKLEQTFDVNLPLAMLFQMPTIEQQASFLEQKANSKSWSSLAPIQPKGSKTPLFLFQGVGIYYPLSLHLGQEQPVYGLSIEMIDDSKRWFNQIEELVALYIKEIKTVQPQGPYYLGGISFGGMIALEAAQQLQAQGEKIALLALFDTWGSNAYVLHPSHKRLLTHLRKFSRSGFERVFSKFNRLKGKSHTSNEVQQQSFSQADKSNSNLSANRHNQKDKKHSSKVTQTYLQARKNYVPQVYSGKITLFRSTQIDKRLEFGDFDPQLGWGDLAAGGLDIIDIPGDHLGILKEPNVAILANELKNCIDKCHNQSKNLTTIS